MGIFGKKEVKKPTDYDRISSWAKSILYYLYGINTDLTKINNIVVRLDSHNDKFFVPTIPIRINKFQSDVFSYYFDQLKPYSNELKYSSPRSIVDWNYEE